MRKAAPRNSARSLRREIFTKSGVENRRIGGNDPPKRTDGSIGLAALGIRPEFILGCILRGEIYGAMPAGMESTLKIRVGAFLLTGVVFGSSLFTIGASLPLSVTDDPIMRFDRRPGPYINIRQPHVLRLHITRPESCPFSRNVNSC